MCELTTGYTKNNCATIGGVKSIIVFNHEHLTNGGSYTLDAAESTLDSFALATGEQGYRISCDKESIAGNQTPTRSRENNTLMIPQTILAILKDDDVETQDLTNILAKGFFGVVVEYKNGNNRLFGLKTGMTLDTEENVSGQLYEDMNGSTLNFIGKEDIKAPIVTESQITALLAPAS